MPGGSFFDDDFMADLPPGSVGNRVATGQVQTGAQAGQQGSAPPPQPDPVRAPPQAQAPTLSTALPPAQPAAQAAPRAQRMSQQQRLDRNRSQITTLDLGGRNANTIAEGDPNYAAAVLSDELQHGHFDALPGSNLFYSWQGGNANEGGRMVFKDRSGREVQGNAAQRAAALADMDEWKDSYYADLGMDVPESAGGAGGAGAGAAGGGPGGGAAGGGSLGGRSFEDELELLLRGGLTGGTSRYSPEVVAAQRASAAEDTAGLVKSQNEALQRAAARKGQTYSGSTEAEAAENRRAGAQQLNASLRQINVDKATADFEDKMASADKALALIDQRRQERIANARNATDIRRIQAEAEAAANKIRADKEIATAEMRERAASEQRGYDAERASGRANRDWQDANAQRDREWAVEDARRREVLELARLGVGG